MDTAIQFLYHSYYDQLSSVITFKGGSSEDAQDIFQEVVVNFIDCVREGKFRGESAIKTFLHAMMRNTWLNELKKRTRSERRDQLFEKDKDVLDKDVNEEMEKRELKKQMLASFEKLGDGCKTILTLYYYENLPMKEIVSQTSYENEQVVRNKKHKCLKALTAFIKGNELFIENLKAAI